MKENIISIIKTGLILLLIGFICTLLLSVCNYMTKDRIAQLSVEAEQEAMMSTLPQAEEFKECEGKADGIVTAVYEGKKEDKTVGYCVKAEPVGYGGAISMMVGVDTEGKVTGVDIVEMSETPGLGAKASEEGFRNQYAGKGGEIKVIKSGTAKENEISAISGATITSKAITQGVNSAIEIAEKLR